MRAGLVVLLAGLAVAGGAYLWAYSGDGEGGANIGAGLLFLVGVGIVCGGIALAIGGAVVKAWRRTTGRHSP